MPQLQPLILKDRAATPVSHNFAPRNIANGVGELVETSGVPIGEARFTISMRKTPTGRYKGVIKLAVPEVQTEIIDGISRPTVVRTGFAELSVDFAASSTTEERNNVIGMIQDALTPSKALVNDTLVKLEGVY